MVTRQRRAGLGPFISLSLTRLPGGLCGPTSRRGSLGVAHPAWLCFSHPGLGWDKTAGAAGPNNIQVGGLWTAEAR